MAPFEEDWALCRVAEYLGLDVTRRDVITVTDEKALRAAGLMRETPDYGRIRKLIEQGATVPGATASTAVEYILRRTA